MKNQIRSFLLIAALGVAVLAFAPPTRASVTNDPPVAATTNAPSLTAGLQEIGAALLSAHLTSISNYSIDPYFTYAPAAPTKYGGGVLGIYNVNDYVGVGLGVDWLGSFSLVSGNATLKLPTHPLAWTGNATLASLQMTPFVLGGVGTPLGGAGATAATISDVGDAFEFGHVFGGTFNVGAAWGTWSNAGAYSVERYHIFFGWSHGF
jgi:hypothetical protein